MLVSKDLASACLEFEADIYLLYHDTQVCKGFQTTIYVGNVCQMVQVMKIYNKVSAGVALHYHHHHHHHHRAK